MSGIYWKGDNKLIQKAEVEEELGFIKYEESSKEFVLWLKDTRDVFQEKYIPGDRFPTIEEAKQKAASSMSARIFNDMWIDGL